MRLQCEKEGLGFNVRAAGLVIRDRRLLLHWKDHEAMWTLPGGRVEFGETAEVAVARELEEELGAKAQALRLLWVVEHFFDLSDARRWHQIAYYFHATLFAGCEAMRREEWTAMDGDVQARYRWVPFDELPRLVVSPSFLAGAVADLPSAPRHLVHTDRLFA